MEKAGYQDESLSFKARAKDLVDRMTVEECAGQMLYEAVAVERLGIKAYNWWNEALHGAARSGMSTVFPQAIGLAAAFDPEVTKAVAEVAATEGRAKYNTFQKYEDYGIYKGLTFWSPNVNIFRDPRWGRGQETYGEDPYLAGKLGASFVKGLQGDDPKYLKAAACAKHFAVHSGPEALRHEFNAVASKQDMEETYLPAFKELADAGVEGFMGAYNRTNGEPCCGSKTLMVDLLRGKWKFDGYFTSDCWAIADFHLHHGVTENITDSVALALENGCDLNCGNTYYFIMEAYKEGKITEEQIRTSCQRLMETRMKLGMFDEKTPFDDIDYTAIDTEESRALNEEIARRTMVLLKNDGILPLKKENLKNVAVIGPNANSIVPLNGNYHGTANQYHTVLEAVRKALPDARVNYSKGCHLYEHKLEDPGYSGDCLAEVKAQTDLADVVILVVGMDETIEGEEIIGKEGFTGDKKDLLLPQSQQDLIAAVCARNTPVVLVNMTGSAIDFAEGCKANAIIQAWYPGAMGGKAVSDLIFGEFSPSGRLPVTFYRNDNNLPGFEDYSMENRTYKFFQEKPLYPFGYGLSYTSFAYSNMKADKEVFAPGENLTVTVTVKNTGLMDGEEVVQCYVRDEEASVRVPVHKLCQTARVCLRAGEEKEVSLTISSDQFCVINEDGEHIWEPGRFFIFAGGSQPDDYSVTLTGSAPSRVAVSMK
ncbi:MAG: glycoside hydrolase family 3 protein [Lachnospiraceae bacterium]|nr:glycoside hydrolase family 3 protein [Lachnospiraceae bacterium]